MTETKPDYMRYNKNDVVAAGDEIFIVVGFSKAYPEFNDTDWYILKRVSDGLKVPYSRECVEDSIMFKPCLSEKEAQ